jgi:hypothetical protein
MATLPNKGLKLYENVLFIINLNLAKYNESHYCMSVSTVSITVSKPQYSP